MAEHLTYLENLVGKRKEISATKLADALGIKRQAIFYQLRIPTTRWRFDRLKKTAEIMGYDWAEMMGYAMEYEQAQARLLKKTSSTGETQARKVKRTPVEQ